jgi:hypothetical protein
MMETKDNGLIDDGWVVVEGARVLSWTRPLINAHVPK